jgi:pimeloyl-ACP methyl ester carboxylesterase
MIEWKRWRASKGIAAILALGCFADAIAWAESARIDSSEYLEVAGAKLFLMTRGANRHAPVLLWLHGGPGGAERPLFRYFDADLERDFVVAYWDQRGTGRSFDANADPRQLTVARHLDDLDAVVDRLRDQLDQERIVLIGHSWGAALGLLYAQKHPDKIAAYIAVSPLVATLAQQRAQYEYVSAEAARRRDDDALSQLRTIEAPPHRNAEDVLAMEALANRYGGLYHTKPNQIWVMTSGMLRGLVMPWEIPRYIRGNNVSLAAMNDELLALDLPHMVPRVEVPVFFFVGRYDHHVDAAIAARYFADLQAPHKQLVWFENSAHNAPFEEPEEFTRKVVSVLQSVGLGGSAD